MDSVELTIIVPIYKAEQYIRKCACSLFSQTIQQGVEFLFINDATPDNSMLVLEEVLEEYPERRDQVTIVNNADNLGISNTRKMAVELAKGQYVGWCDSDDWCESNMYECMLKVALSQEKDVVVCNFDKIMPYGTVVVKHGCTGDPKDAAAAFCMRDLFPYQLWETIIKKELISQGFEQIRATMSGEDCYAMLIALYYAKSIAYVPDVLYHHLFLESSLSQNIVTTRSEWEAQKYNINLVKSLYGDGRRYQNSWIDWEENRKRTYITVFSSLWEFYRTYPEVELMNIRRCRKSKLARCLMRIAFSIYPLYWLRYYCSWRKNRLNLFWW